MMSLLHHVYNYINPSSSVDTLKYCVARDDVTVKLCPHLIYI